MLDWSEIRVRLAERYTATELVTNLEDAGAIDIDDVTDRFDKEIINCLEELDVM